MPIAAVRETHIIGKYGKQWVVTRDAMSREYGDPVTV